MATIDSTDARLSTHEEICAFRYEAINARLKRIESIMIAAAGLMIVSMTGVIWTVLYHAKWEQNWPRKFAVCRQRYMRGN